MPDQNLTSAELDEQLRDVEMDMSRTTKDVLGVPRVTLASLLAAARRSLEQDERIRELEARLGVIERACVAGLFNGIPAVSCEVLLSVSNGSRALPADCTRETPMVLAGRMKEETPNAG